MKVYDIISEARAVGQGKYAGFVWDQPSSNGNITVTFPDGRTTVVRNQADARQVADDWINRINPPPNDPRKEELRRRLAEVEREGRAAYRSRWTRFISPRAWIIRGLSSIGIATALYQSLDERMHELFVQHNILPEDDPLYINEREYSYAVTAYYATWATATLLPVIRAVLKTPSAIRAFFNVIRTARLSAAAAAQGLSVVTGPGFLATAAFNALWLVVSEVTLYLAARWALSSEAAQTLLSNIIIGFLYKHLAAVFNIGEDAQQQLTRLLAPTIEIFDSELARQAENDARELTGLNPDASFRRNDARLNPQQRNTNGSTAGPAASDTAAATTPSAPSSTPAAGASNNIGIAPALR